MIQSHPEAEYRINHIEILVPVAKPIAYWHIRALGFRMKAYKDPAALGDGVTSYWLECGRVSLIISSVNDAGVATPDPDRMAFLARHPLGAYKVCLEAPDVIQASQKAIDAGAISVPSSRQDPFPNKNQIRLYARSVIEFITTGSDAMTGFQTTPKDQVFSSGITHIDHLAAELYTGDPAKWIRLLTEGLGLRHLQHFGVSEENRTGMHLDICQSSSAGLTFVLAQPDTDKGNKAMTENLNRYGDGIHHIAFACEDIMKTAKSLEENGVEFATFPKAYYDLLRQREDFLDVDIDTLEKQNILMYREGQGCLLQKFMKPFGDSPFFFYELVQRINGYEGFAIKNINVLKQAEEMQIMHSRQSTTSE